MNTISGADAAFLKTAAVCAAISAVTTILLWGLPFMQGNFSDPSEVYRDAAYMARLWVNLVHVAFALIGYAGLAYICRANSPGFAIAGLTFFAIWAAVEASGMAVSIFAVNGIWRPAITAATSSAADRENIDLLISAWGAIWEGLFFVILSAFLLGTLFLGLATRALPGRLAQIATNLLLVAVPLTLLIMLGGYAGQSWADAITQIAYPILQPISRAILAILLLRFLAETTRAPRH